MMFHSRALFAVNPIATLLVAALLLTSCVSTKKGSYLGDFERARQEASAGSYNVRARYNASADGQVVLEVQEERLYQIQYSKTFRKIKNRRAAPWWVLMLTGTGVGIAGLAMTPECFGPEPEDEPEVLCETPEEKAAVRRAIPYLAAGLSTAVVGLFGAAWAHADSSGAPTNDVITEGQFSRTEKAPHSQLEGESVSVRLNGQTKRNTRRTTVGASPSTRRATSACKVSSVRVRSWRRWCCRSAGPLRRHARPVRMDDAAVSHYGGALPPAHWAVHQQRRPRANPSWRRGA